MTLFKKKKTVQQKQEALNKLETDLKAQKDKLKKEEQAEKARLSTVPKPPKHLQEDDKVHKPDEWKEMKKRKKFGWWDKAKIKFFPATTYLIHMEYSNGTLKTFILKSSNETFKYKGRMYYLRYEDSLFHLTHAMYELRYHEDYATPIDREIHKKEDTNNKGKEKAYFSVISHNLKPLIKMEYVKALAEAQELSKYLKLSLIVGLLVLIVGAFSAIQLYRLAPLA